MFSSSNAQRVPDDIIYLIMPVTYTTAALVRKRNKNISSDLVDADIDQFIYEAEAIIDAAMKVSLITSFDAAKHAILRSAATDIATLTTLSYDPGTAFLELEDAKMTTDLLTAAADRALNLLADPRTVAYLRSL
jgi:predicted RNA-binding Zn ribbon-like protein